MDKIEQAFQKFDEEIPEVYEHLERLALDLFSRGVRRYGCQALFEVLRYEKILRTHGDDFKLNNDYAALYSRKLLRLHPELQNCNQISNGEYRDFFQLRVRSPRGTQHRAADVSFEEEDGGELYNIDTEDPNE